MSKQTSIQTIKSHTAIAAEMNRKPNKTERRELISVGLLPASCLHRCIRPAEVREMRRKMATRLLRCFKPGEEAKLFTLEELAEALSVSTHRRSNAKAIN